MAFWRRISPLPWVDLPWTARPLHIRSGRSATNNTMAAKTTNQHPTARDIDRLVSEGFRRLSVRAKQSGSIDPETPIPQSKLDARSGPIPRRLRAT
jgi:hypothetical protein